MEFIAIYSKTLPHLPEATNRHENPKLELEHKNTGLDAGLQRSDVLTGRANNSTPHFLLPSFEQGKRKPIDLWFHQDGCRCINIGFTNIVPLQVIRSLFSFPLNNTFWPADHTSDRHPQELIFVDPPPKPLLLIIIICFCFGP